MRSSSLLNVIGSNTIAIYTTHRILVEIFSKPDSANERGYAGRRKVELTLLLIYPFVSLLICTVAGLLVRKLSQRAFNVCCSPRLLCPLPSVTPAKPSPQPGAIQFAKPCRLRIMNSIAYEICPIC